jgi:hypothetical protein
MKRGVLSGFGFAFKIRSINPTASFYRSGMRVPTHFDHIRVSHYEQHTLAERRLVVTHTVHGLRTRV